MRARHAAVALALLSALPALAAKLALLVGVGEYPALAPELQLKAPPADVRLMRRVLLQRGFAAADIATLADGVEGAQPPTRENILAALRALAGRARPGDIVHLHFSGHGSLQPGPEGGARWQPVFLPADARGWDGRSRERVANAITDTELRDAADRLNAAGAFVFAVFDACHSARLVRGALPGTDARQVRVRQVAPAALGLPDPPAAEPPSRWAEPAAGAGADRGRAVYFYAAQSYELATTLSPREGAGGEWHGLLSWSLTQALALGQPMSYRQLGQHLLSRYDQHPAASAAPLWGGDGLDDAVHGQLAPLLRQWPVQQRQGRLELGAGALDGVAEGALLALLADPLAPAGANAADPPRGTLGYLRVSLVEADRAALEPVAWQGFAAPSPSRLNPGSWARLVAGAPSFELRVALDPAGCGNACAAGRALARLRREGVPGVDVRWIEGAQAGDLRLRATERGVQLLLAGTSESDRSHWGYPAPAEGDATAFETLVQQTAGALNRVAKARNLVKLAAQLALRGSTPGLRLDLSVLPQGREPGQPVTGDRLVALSVGDQLRLGGANGGADPLDMVAFWIGADQSIRRLYPEDRRDNARLAPGDRLRRSGWVIEPGSEGTERLLVISAPMRRGREAADFRSLEQPALGRLRGAIDPGLQALFDACVADSGARGAAAPAPAPDRLGLQVFTFRITP